MALAPRVGSFIFRPATVIRPLTRKREIVDPEGELLPGETVIKLYYCKRLDGYVTIPGISLFRVAEDRYKVEAI
jgi:hypothetical protein